MSDVFIEVLDRNWGSYRPTTGEIYLQPNSYRQASLGGPVELSVSAYGTKTGLFDLIELLRCPIRMFDWYAQDLFWGYVNTVQVRTDAMEVSVSLDAMANKIKLEYTTMIPGEAIVGDQLFTDWTQDTMSISTYGVKELIASLPDITLTLAEAKRNLLLQQKRFPISAWYMSGEKGSLSATMLCKGWWASLGWKYYEDTSGYEAYTIAGEGVQVFGDISARMWVAQSFQLGVATGWYASRILVKIRKEGSPGDNVRVSLYSNGGSTPSTELAYGTASGSSISTDYNWVIVALNTPVLVSPSTTYWVVITRSGAADAVNYYFTDVNEELGYPRGVFRYGDGGTWGARTPDADMNFEIEGVTETSNQLEKLVTAAGQFITAIKLEIASGVYSCPYRPGTSTGLEEAMVLLQAGTSNNRRMLAEVTPARVLRVYEEPIKPAVPSLLLTPDGRVKDLTGALWPPFWSPVGKWVGMHDVIPSTLDSTRIADPYMIFVDEYSYSFIDKVGTLYPRSEPSPWDVGIIAEEDKP